MHNRFKILVCLLIALGFFYTCQNHSESSLVYQSGHIEIVSLTENTFVHTSFLTSDKYGRVPCNGLIIKKGNEVLIVDTPLSDTASLELINWVEDNLKAKIKYIIPSHFHVDCTAGLDAFHDQGIRSMGNIKTIEQAILNEEKVPENGFRDSLNIMLGTSEVQLRFLGEGHTADNIIAYYPDEQVLFGGCLIKQLGAGKGNLEDANVDAWPLTVRRIKNSFPNIRYVVPGHGQSGDVELLDYTIQLFE